MHGSETQVLDGLLHSMILLVCWVGDLPHTVSLHARLVSLQDGVSPGVNGRMTRPSVTPKTLSYATVVRPSFLGSVSASVVSSSGCF